MTTCETPTWHMVAQGKSVEDQPIVLLLSDTQKPGPIDTLILAATHGDEHESELVLSEFLSDTDFTRFNSKRVAVIPVLNPDGVARDQRTNAHAVDLNRNFPTKDWTVDNEDTPYYSGPDAASEPETRFLIDVLDVYPPRKIISLHTPYKVINYDGPAEALAHKLSKINSYPVQADIGYATPGSFGTYAGKERGIAVITLELPEGDAFGEDDMTKNIALLYAAIDFAL